MAMNDTSSTSLRSGARFFGILFQYLAFLTFAGTLVTSIRTAHLGQQVGISGSKDPLVWITLAIGLFATFVFVGFGYALGMLCTVYDRQEWTRPTRQLPSRTDATPQVTTPSPQPIPTPTAQTPVANPTTELEIQVVQSPLKAAPAPATEPPNRDAKAQNWLTRDRHFKKPKE